ADPRRGARRRAYRRGRLGCLAAPGSRIPFVLVALLEEPDREHDQPHEQRDFEEEHEKRKQENGPDLPESETRDAERGELQERPGHSSPNEGKRWDPYGRRGGQVSHEGYNSSHATRHGNRDGAAVRRRLPAGAPPPPPPPPRPPRPGRARAPGDRVRRHDCPGGAAKGGARPGPGPARRGGDPGPGARP